MNKVSRMLSDMQASKDMQMEFNRPEIAGIQFTVEILTNGVWPNDAAPRCEIPQPMKSCTTQFLAFYKNKHHNRRLDWLYQHGQTEVQPTFTHEPYELIMNVFQATIISLFNEKDEWTVKDLRDKTQIPQNNFNVGLLQLCNPKFKVLIKEIKKPTLGNMEKI